jgi:hypothetical protein
MRNEGDAMIGDGWRRIGKAGVIGLFGLAVLMLAGCPKEPETESPAPPPPPVRTLEPGESVVFNYPAESRWIPSEYWVQNGDRIQIRPAGECVSWAPQSLRFRIVKIPFSVMSGEPFTVTRPGRLEFSVDLSMIPEGAREASVEITRLK